MNILIYMFCDKKNFLTIFNTEKTFQNKKKYVFFKKVLPISFMLQGYGKPYYIKGVHRVKKQMFYKVVVLEIFAKFTGKQLCWSHFLIKLQA